MVNTVLKSKSLYFLWILLVLLISIGVVINAYLSLIAFLLLMIALLFMASNDSIVLLIALVPFANIFKISTDATSLFTIAEIFMVLLLVLKRKKIKASFFLVVMLLAVYMLVFSLENIDMLLIIKVVVGFLLIYYSMEFISQEDVKNITYLLSFGILIMMGLTLNNNYLEYVLPYYDDINYLVTSGGSITETLRASGFFGDPNYCAVLLVITLSMLCLLYYYKKINNIFWILFIPIAILGFFTYSKSYFLCLSALILFLFMFVLLPKHKGFAFFGSIALLVIVFMMINGKFEVLNLLLERFEGEDLTTGRDVLNSRYLQYIFSNLRILFVGEGIAAEYITEFGHIVHNSYIELLYRMGLIGGILYVACLVLSSKTDSNQNKITAKRKFVNLIPILFLCVMYFALAGITRYELPIYFIIVFLALNFNKLPSNETNMTTLRK